jgi:hypothetical protein
MVTIKGMPRILKATCHTGGDGWKNTDVQGEVVYCWDTELPKPYAPGQFPRVGFTNYTCSSRHFSFEPVDEAEYQGIIDGLISKMRDERNDAKFQLDRIRRKSEHVPAGIPIAPDNSMTTL